ncbi:tripartite tricarboxylate transporter substrate binding protein [Roseomonas terrae]|uniref:Tripartite tricarboxylate transporter substrate binding protein n=2 Tax=Neoroseomonas terrae TaxID=424799 RepID=A0ABS5EM20_9PROT|nr:tripartite tricarboxylate transporter substrate binding protein [Neoroseomonas terrae]
MSDAPQQGDCRMDRGDPRCRATSDCRRRAPCRRDILRVAAVSLLACQPATGRAQEASRPITLVVPFPAGSNTDVVTRALAQQLQESLGQPVVVDNRPGAQGTLAAAHVARSQPDGQTLLMGSSVMFVAGSLIRNLPYDPVGSFQPVSGVGSTSMIFMVQATSPIRTIADFHARARQSAQPMTIGFGSPSGQVVLALFATASGTRPTAVSYRGIPQTMTDLAGGHIDAAVVDLGSGLAQMRSGHARAIAVSAGARSTLAPDVPTLQEGFPSAEMSLETIIAVQGPARMQPDVVTRLDAAIRAALTRPALQERFATASTAVLTLDAAGLDSRIRADNVRWEALIRQAGIQPE